MSADQPVACCSHPRREHTPEGKCHGWNMSGGPSGMRQQCGCRGWHEPTPEPPVWEDPALREGWVQPPPRDPYLSRLEHHETRWEMTRGFGAY